MLPKSHFIIGIIIGALLLPFVPWYYVIAIIAANVLIDFDHYIVAVIRNKGDCRLDKALEYYDRYNAIKNKKTYNFTVFHTIEFHILVLFMSTVSPIFFYVFIGMLIHSLTDLVFLIKHGNIIEREYWFWRWWKNDRKI